ncbi:MAG: hypothetical protein KA956_06875 [Pyrinomonadaceae bacterium]|nr:hypothetical protein [Acidobacteriota bacterium]MBK7935156.1 hypothetical protein [Acidobacteriota bacterium]MBP7376183.1 hypothetical protein [Pyrinomonadaceae bacterium]
MYKFSEEFVVETGFLRVTTRGEFALDELFGFIGRVKAEAEAADRDRIMIDSSEIEGILTEADRFQGGQKVAEVFAGEMKVVWIMPADQITKLGEMAAVNRGADFLVTASQDEALKWLLED